eukprot:comp4707_c0_seq1/m.870 comp4707_c0_seq1/g.870  ORF comp4707_c0_seq1/g.870 comp4707_c0_seq1/m.870 type:complete len:117 (-) comp4707_c0_seq1:241-591(-)
MGNSLSSTDLYSANDFELVIRASKELEHLLATQFQASGNGLGEKARSATHNGQPLPQALTRRINMLVRERNKLIHDLEYNKIADRNAFIRDFEAARAELKKLLESKKGAQSSCAVM